MQITVFEYLKQMTELFFQQPETTTTCSQQLLCKDLAATQWIIHSIHSCPL